MSFSNDNLMFIQIYICQIAESLKPHNCLTLLTSRSL